MVRLTNLQRALLIGQVQNGATAANAARQFGVHKSTVNRLLVRFNETGDVKDRPRSGRNRVTTRQEDNFVTATAARNRHQTGDFISYSIVNKNSSVSRLFRATLKPKRNHTH